MFYSTQKEVKSYNIGRTFLPLFSRFYKGFIKTVRQSVYSDRISGSAASRYIVHGRCEIEDWPNSERIAANTVVAHATGAMHIERIVRMARSTGNSPFIKPHIHPINIFNGFAIISF